MTATKRILRTLTLVALGAACASCDELLNPCALSAGNGNPKLMDGIWAVTRINGAPIPANGFKVNATDYLRAGSMDFKTRDIFGVSCSDPTNTHGIVLARYVMGDGGAGLKPGQSATGDFEFINRTGVVTISAFKLSLSGNVASRSFTLTGLHPDTWQQLTITLTR